MKALFIFLCLAIFAFNAKAQSPYLSVALTMADTTKIYVIDMRLIKIKNATKYKDWFTHEKSAINLTVLKDTDFVKSDYLEKYNNDEKATYRYNWGNQKMAFETIIVIRIKQENIKQPMYIVVPVMTKSFTTFVQIVNVPFIADTYYELKIEDEFNSGLQLKYDFTKTKKLPITKRTILVPLE